MDFKHTPKSFSQKISKLAVIGVAFSATISTSFLVFKPSPAYSVFNQKNDNAIASWTTSKDSITPVQTQLIAQSRRNFSQFLFKLAQRETGRRNPPSNIKNRLGFIGKYQFGEALLIDLGYYKSGPHPYYRPWISNNPAKNLWKNKWTGKNGIRSKRDFLANKNNIQNVAMAEALRLNCRYLNSALQKKGRSTKQYLGRRVNGVVVTTSGILAASHLNGAQAAAGLLTNGKISRDENGTSIVAYLREFGGYRIPNRYAGNCQ